jgi:nitrogen fixation/metabolism regulation signal transduction histidine kinase
MARQVTHEIKNPLTPMKLSIQMMQRMKKENDSERFDEFFDKSSKVLIEQIESLSAIATAFSNFAKMPEAQKERLNICDSVMSVAELFRHNDENVAVNCDICNSIIFILADKTQLKQVFSNIIKNAIQSIPQSRNDGEVNISARTDEKQITIEIKDNGSGIPADIKERIFTPNFTTKNSGMGLGLAIVKNIVNNNDGDIWFNSEEGKGTTFFVRFPVIK